MKEIIFLYETKEIIIQYNEDDYLKISLKNLKQNKELIL